MIRLAVLPIVVAWLTVASFPVPGFAQTTSIKPPQPLQPAMAAVAAKLAAAIKGMKHDSVSIGRFDGPPQLDASSGPGIAKILADELALHEITVKKRAELGLKGSFHTARTGANRLAVQIKGEMFNSIGEPLFTFDHQVGTAQDISSLLGLTAELPANKPEKQREQVLEKSIATPQTVVANARVTPSATSPYALEIHVMADGEFRPRPAVNDEGLAFAEINRGETYGVMVVNDSPHAAAVRLSIDGVNVFAFSDHKEYKHYIIPAKKSVILKGWHRTNAVSDSFQIGEFSKSAAASLLPDGGSVGTITATFAAAWPENSPPPADELAAQLVSRGAGRDATVRGPEVQQTFNEVRMHTGVVRAAISIRYSKPKDLPPGEAP
jgi:hypothetical protein